MWKALKRFAWFWLKSPQRKRLGYGTILTDIKGLLGLFTGQKSKETIWMCVGLKDRTENLKRLVESLEKINANGSFALSVYDQGSTDADALHAWLKTNWSGLLLWKSEPADFTRTVAFNRAMKQATGDLIFVCDADMTLPNNLEKLLRRYVRPQSAWFPVCQGQLLPETPDWKWLSAGTGLFAGHKKWHGKAMVYDERFKSWGGEDWDMFFRFYQSGIMPLRTRCEGLYHHWHESLRPENYEKLF
ncbi:MAG: glycosyltransferase family 2 protein [Sphingomonadales bacterium]|nr:glycosyltransferase family 2 protein [Sphingomonadales bacterium]